MLVVKFCKMPHEDFNCGGALFSKAHLPFGDKGIPQSTLAWPQLVEHVLLLFDVPGDSSRVKIAYQHRNCVLHRSICLQLMQLQVAEALLERASCVHVTVCFGTEQDADGILGRRREL